MFIKIAALVLGLLIIWAYFKNSAMLKRLKLDPAEAKKRLDSEKGIVLLDVRSQEEFFENHIPKSILLPVNRLRKEAGQKLTNKQATIFVYCRSGNRSRVAIRILQKQGYTNIYDLGGIIHWPYKTVSGKK